MAEVPYTRIENFPNAGVCHAVYWVLTGSDVGLPWARPDLPSKTFQVTGDFDVGGDVQIEAALHPTAPVYGVLKDINGTPMSGIAAAYLETSQNNSTLVRPVADTVVSVTVVCVAAGPRTSGG